MKITFFIIISLWVTACFAQDTIERRSRLTDSVVEKFQVLKANKDVRNGLYKAFFRHNTIIAMGNYTNNVKTGTWHFYDRQGRLNQTYDYDNKSLLFLSPVDSTVNLRFRFDSKIAPTDTLTRPFKIGESYYGYIPYVSIFKMPFDTFGIDTDQFVAEIELLISPLGVLADYKIHLVSQAYQYDHTFTLDTKLFPRDDGYFVAATVNQRPVVSSIFIKCAVNPDGSLDFF